MKSFLLAVVLQLLVISMFAQNIGINTAAPLKRLSVNGSVLIDQNNMNTGTLDSAALVFGTHGAGIFSNKTVGQQNIYGLDFWTNNTRKMTIWADGMVGINLQGAS